MKTLIMTCLLLITTLFVHAENNDAYRYKWVGTFVKGSPYTEQVIASSMMWEGFADVIYATGQTLKMHLFLRAKQD